MSTLTITTTYDTAQILYESQIDEIKTPIETYFNTTQIEGSNIQANILDGATYLSDDSISADKLASNSVTTAKLADSTPSSDTGITSAKINTDAVTTAKIDDLAVTTAKIDDLDITTAKIGGTVPKSIMLELPTASATLSDLTVYRSLDSISAFVGAGSETLVGSLTFSGLTSGKPVLINLQSNNTSSGYGYIEQIMYVFFTHTEGPMLDNYAFQVTQRVSCSLILKKDASTVYTADISFGDIFNSKTYLRIPLSVFNYIDIASSTSHTYSLYIKCNAVTLTDYVYGHGDITTGDVNDEMPSGAYGEVLANDNVLTVNSAKLVAIQLV